MRHQMLRRKYRMRNVLYTDTISEIKHTRFGEAFFSFLILVHYLDRRRRSPCPDSSTVLLTPPFPSLNSMAYLPVSFSVGSVICSHSWSPTTPLLMRSVKAMAESLAVRWRDGQQGGQTFAVEWERRLENSLVVPSDWQQVVVVADKSVKSDAFTCTGDLERSGRIGCSWKSFEIIRRCTDQIRKIYIYIYMRNIFLPMNPNTSFIRSLKPGGESHNLIRQLDDGGRVFLISPPNTHLDLSGSKQRCPSLSRPSAQPHRHQHPSWKSDGVAEKTVRLWRGVDRSFFSICLEKGKLLIFWYGKDAAENTCRTQRQKSSGTKTDRWVEDRCIPRQGDMTNNNYNCSQL